MSGKRCRFCGGEYDSTSSPRVCPGCGGHEWIQLRPQAPEPLPPPQPEAPAQPTPTPIRPSPLISDPLVSGTINTGVGCLWVIVVLVIAAVCFGIWKSSADSDSYMRGLRFSNGYETQDDIKNHPDEYAKALKERKK